MASVKKLKKRIDNQIFQLISDCYLFAGLHPEYKPDEVSGIIAEAVGLRNDLIARINNPDGKDNPKLIKKYYQSINNDLITGADQLFCKLSSLPKKKNK